MIVAGNMQLIGTFAGGVLLSADPRASARAGRMFRRG
jgi:hypothetical protein